MSSHHVIRDGQEPPVLLADAEASQHPLLPDLLEWSPVTICLDVAVPGLLRRGLKADYILCLKSAPDQWRYILDDNYSAQVVSTPGWPSVTEVVKQVLAEVHADHLHIVTGQEAERDWMASFGKVVVFTPSRKWSHYTTGTFRKWMPAGQELWVEGSFGEVEGNVRYQTDCIETTASGMVRINGLLDAWIGEPLTFSLPGPSGASHGGQ